MAYPSTPALSDLLDRALDKGVVINAQLVITLAGIPLVGVNLWAAVAGVETLLQYGLMEGVYPPHPLNPPLLEGEGDRKY